MQTVTIKEQDAYDEAFEDIELMTANLLKIKR